MRSVSTCLVSNKTKVNMCVRGRMPVSMVQSWRLKKEGVVPGEGEGETLTVGNAQKHTYIHTYIIIMRQDHQLPAQ